MVDERNYSEKLSDDVARFGGSWRFIITFILFLAAWITFNTLEATSRWHFDESPYILLNLILNIAFALEAPFIMMSQNRASEKQDDSYRNLLHEIKELVNKDIGEDQYTNRMLKEIGEDHRTMRQQLSQLLAAAPVTANDVLPPGHPSAPSLSITCPETPGQRPPE
jgi:uncharacterized membrane protein